MIQKQIQLLFEKPMDRRDFLLCIGKGVLLLTGVGALMRGLVSFTQEGHTSTVTNHIHTLDPGHGFGSSKFGT